MKTITIRLSDEDEKAFALVSGRSTSEKVKGLIHGGSTPFLAKYLAEKSGRTANAVIEDALQQYAREKKVLKWEFYFKDTLAAALGIDKMAKEYQTDSFLNNIEIHYYDN